MFQRADDEGGTGGSHTLCMLYVGELFANLAFVSACLRLNTTFVIFSPTKSDNVSEIRNRRSFETVVEMRAKGSSTTKRKSDR